MRRMTCALIVLAAGCVEPAYADPWPGGQTAGRVVLGYWLNDGDVTDGNCIMQNAATSAGCTSANRFNIGITSPGEHTLIEFRCTADLNVIASGSFTMKLHTFDDDFTLTERATATGTYAAGKTDDLITSGAIAVSIPATERGYIVEMDAETTGTDDFELVCSATVVL